MGDKPFQAEAQTFGKAMNQIAYGETMMAAVRDYKKEVLAQQGPQQHQTHSLVDMEGLMDDEELQKLHADRIEQLRAEREKRAQLQMQGHGQLTEITEGDFLEVVTKAELVVVHFMHREFERCKIMDKHLAMLAARYFATRFVKLSAPDTPFFATKLNIKTLPCIVGFINGVAVGRVVGFEGLGGKDDFSTDALEGQLLEMGVIVPVGRDKDDMDDHLDGPGKSIRKSQHSYQRTASDEDSDFDG